MALLRIDQALTELGAEEAGDMLRLLNASVPLAKGYLVDVDADADMLQRVVEAARDDGPVIRLLPLFPTRAASAEFEFGDQEGDVFARLDELLEKLLMPAMQRGGRVKRLRIIGCDISPSGGATSADRDRGDPEEVHVWSDLDPAAVWRIDRRSTRAKERGGELDVVEAESVADLVDRVQLALGVPVEIRWCVQNCGRPSVLTVQEQVLSPTFTPGNWNRLALVAADEGTVAPLAIDALDRALGAEVRGPNVEPSVRRVYARPYRCRDDAARLGRREPAPLAVATAGVARLIAEATPVVTAAIRFERTLDTTFARLDVPRLSDLDLDAVTLAVRERHRLVAEALLLLDQCREITRNTLEALEAVVGPLPADCYPALAAPRSRRTRRRIHDRLAKLRSRIEKEHGRLVPPEELSGSLLTKWNETKRDLEDLRPLGIDVTPLAIGHDDATLLRALERQPRFGHAARERARSEATQRVIRLARAGSLGRLRAALVTSLTLVLQRIARAKGGVGEGVAAALLRLRRAACETGSRLVEQVVLDRADDALYLNLVELSEALSGEPGAYAARVRFRREDDQRWAAYDAPRRIGRGR